MENREVLLQRAQEHYKFPCKIQFLLLKESEEDVSIVSLVVNSKAQVGNVKYDYVSKGTWTSEGSALITIKEFHNADDYLDECDALRRTWGFALRNPKEKADADQ